VTLPARHLVEACVCSPAEARGAVASGADRLELCGPGEGGTTPSAGLMETVIPAAGVPVHVMIRPHSESFVLAPEWRAIMRRDIVRARRAGAQGIVVGPITPAGTLDEVALAEFVYEAGDLAVVVHRAFDALREPARALDRCVTLGVTAVLTSGGASGAAEAADRLAAWQRQVGNALTILAGGGVRAHTVAPLLAQAELRALHASARDTTAFGALVASVRAHEAAPSARIPSC
jgi:copper homeostasis protein